MNFELLLAATGNQQSATGNRKFSRAPPLAIVNRKS